jgi:hypothetical protein
MLLIFFPSLLARAAPAAQPIDCFISTGDNHWLGESLPIDSKASIEASFELLARLGVRRVYWRGLQDAIINDTGVIPEENCRYAFFWRNWSRRLYAEVDPDRTAAAAARRRGMEFWGVGTLDWGSSPDIPCYGFPYDSESSLRREHPEWVPVDRSGLLQQGGPIEWAYAEARKAAVDLQMKYVRRDGYNGVLLLSYVENFSMRFQDEFGFNEPIVREFRRRTGVDLRTQPFSRTASRHAWYSLRGEYLTQYLREFKERLRGEGKKLGIYVNPDQPHFTLPWSGELLTAGHIYCDLERWVRDRIIDQFVVDGNCQPESQTRAVDDCLWLCRQTPSCVSPQTSDPAGARWKNYRGQGVVPVMSVGADQSYLMCTDRIPAQPPGALSSDDPILRMRVLAQIIVGQTKAAAAQVTPLAQDKNVIVRRLALQALGRLKDPASVPVIERGLEDGENCVRCAAGLALAENHRPQSTAKMLAAIDRFGDHPLAEIALQTLPQFRPLPRAELAAEAAKRANSVVRSTAMRALALMPDETLLRVFIAGLSDSDRFVRFAAAEGLANYPRSVEAVEALLTALRHDDPVLSDRAATSLAAIGECRRKEIEPLRGRIVAGLRELYMKFGEGCRRADRDWGYRPVGNALLKLGADGEKILQTLIDQSNDRRLALLAWKSLYIRLDTGGFREVTEKENDEAFRHLPAFLRTAAAGAARQ